MMRQDFSHTCLYGDTDACVEVCNNDVNFEVLQASLPQLTGSF